ncbi:nucleoside phosphorylase [Collimonas sp. PA-H2]|uniref:phosphorylase family protein n=1 Tax=Collimonas sp. PA-H2 TaxID=1881062 RepID=UPI000BF8EB6A|nr:5'-methylthioadenosine/S-adenosylhomocysteine nucleosidase [Collimonas sp. PA-H2]PFH12390.1 nucleoside phosphorylase [Collimonas sp. PA-H2]
MKNANKTLVNEYFLLAGSISDTTDNSLIDRAHEFVRAFVTRVLDAGAGFVVYLSSEPVNLDQKPLLFDWTVVRAIDATLPGESPKVRLKVVVSDARMQLKASPEQRVLINRLVARGIAESVTIDDELLTGGNVGDEQTNIASAMVALGGGKGVLDRGRKMVKKLLPVLPLDLQLGANSEDGQGALAIMKAFRAQPLTYMPHTGEEVARKLSALSLQEPVLDFDEIARKIVDIFEAEVLAKRASEPPDVLVLTALPIELAAAKQAFQIGEEIFASRTASGFHIWSAHVTRPDGTFANCIIASFGGAGNVDAAATTALLLSELRPAHVVMLGIAAGMRDKCKLGEVVISDRMVAYEGGAALEGGKVEARPEITKLRTKVQQDLNGYLANTTAARVRLERAYSAAEVVFPIETDAGPIVTDLMPRPATIASGELLLRDPVKFRALRELHGKTEVAEMEGAGVFAACAQRDVPVLVIRGISDFGDSLKDNRFHALAAKAAAVVTADYVANGLSITS